jgi:diguanylate cyclase (GGDEF)-like protein
LNAETGHGEVVYQLADLDKHAVKNDIPNFSALLSLFHSQVRQQKTLFLKGSKLGDKAYSDMFGIPDITAVMLLPVFEPDGQLSGAITLFQQHHQKALSKQSFAVLEEVSHLVLSACSRAQVLEKALEIATTDELTGAVNRRGFYTRFDAEIERARRNQSDLCLAIIDIDHFKSVNDTYGHLTGDFILREVAHHIMQNMRKSDLLCRFGGEEFTIVLPETTLRSAADLLERIRRKLERMTIETEVGPIQITFSAGITLLGEDVHLDSMKAISQALARADEALYQAKQYGRNRVICTEV